jgi:hypothetical protein
MHVYLFCVVNMSAVCIACWLWTCGAPQYGLIACRVLMRRPFFWKCPWMLLFAWLRGPSTRAILRTIMCAILCTRLFDIKFSTNLYWEVLTNRCNQCPKDYQNPKGSITLAFWMCILNVRFTVACVFNVIFEFLTLQMTSKTHATVKRTPKLHIQNASVIYP